MDNLAWLIPPLVLIGIFWIIIFAIAARVLHRVWQRVWRDQ
jgi:tryptophan-rich sensory protein